MIRKIALIFFCLTLIISCGKKAEPEYKETKIIIKTAKIS